MHTAVMRVSTHCPASKHSWNVCVDTAGNYNDNCFKHSESTFFFICLQNGCDTNVLINIPSQIIIFIHVFFHETNSRGSLTSLDSK